MRLAKTKYLLHQTMVDVDGKTTDLRLVVAAPHSLCDQTKLGMVGQITILGLTSTGAILTIAKMERNVLGLLPPFLCHLQPSSHHLHHPRLLILTPRQLETRTATIILILREKLLKFQQQLEFDIPNPREEPHQDLATLQ